MTTSMVKDSSLVDADSLINERDSLMTGMPGANLDDFPEYVLAPTLSAAITGVNTHQMAAMSARIFRFSTTSLKSLKIAAFAYATNDALSALDLASRHTLLA
jgi:hypothetical protein